MGARAKPTKTGPAKPFRAAFNRALDATRGNPHLLDEIVDKFLKQAKTGSFAHQKELMDRVDGRVAYKMGGDDEGEPITVIVTGVPRAGRDDSGNE